MAQQWDGGNWTGSNWDANNLRGPNEADSGIRNMSASLTGLGACTASLTYTGSTEDELSGGFYLWAYGELARRRRRKKKEEEALQAALEAEEAVAREIATLMHEDMQREEAAKEVARITAIAKAYEPKDLGPLESLYKRAIAEQTEILLAQLLEELERQNEEDELLLLLYAIAA